MAAVGIYFSRKQTSLDTYLRAEQSMGWLPVGLSLMAALNSGMDYLMQPSATINYGLVLVFGILSWLLLYPWVAHVAFPFYHRLNYFTVYEYLEARFDVRVRTLAAMIFILWRVGWMATAMYVPSLAINAATGGQVDLNTMTIVVGVLVTLYTMLGGIQAVIWNDVVQFCIMFGGLAATVAIAWSTLPGGLGEIWAVNLAAGKLDWWPPLVDPSANGALAQIESFFRQPMTLPTLMIALVIGRMAQYTSDQVMVQRLQTTRSLRDARSAFVVNAAGDALWMVGLSFVGFALFAYFQQRTLPPEFATDKLVPYFMSLAFPAGAVGLVIAAIMAASLSSIDSAINSCTSVAVVDLYNRVWRGTEVRNEAQTAESQRQQVRVSRIFTVIFGVLGTTLACNVSRIGSLLEINAKVVNAFTGPLFGIFLLAMFSRRAGSVAVLAAGVIGAFTAYYVAYHSGIGFMWPSTFGLAATLATGALLSLAMPMSAGDARTSLTWKAVMTRGREATAPEAL
ncbi:MAG TPA: sodium/solute symporter [Vicinamibacterales bacterium]